MLFGQYSDRVPRSGAAARNRLERAALELYAERGYDGATAAEIAARAGVTERTFFRHFVDKREVLFNVESGLQEALAKAFTDVPADVPPLAAVLRAFRSTGRMLQDDRPLAEARNRVIAATPALRERELAKAEALSAVVAHALRARGLDNRRASLLAKVGTAALGHAVQMWFADSTADIDQELVRTFVEVHELAGSDPLQPGSTVDLNA